MPTRISWTTVSVVTLKQCNDRKHQTGGMRSSTCHAGARRTDARLPFFGSMTARDFTISFFVLFLLGMTPQSEAGEIGLRSGVDQWSPRSHMQQLYSPPINKRI